MPGARKNRVPAPNQHSDFPFRSVTSPERSIGRTVLRHTMSYTVGPHPSRAPWSTYRSPSHRKKAERHKQEGYSRRKTPQLSSPVLVYPVPSALNSRFVPRRKKCMCAAIPVELILAIAHIQPIIAARNRVVSALSLPKVIMANKTYCAALFRWN